MVRGPVGIGKTALLNAAVGSARSKGAWSLSVTGVQAETRMPFASLRQLLSPILREPSTVAPEGRELILSVSAGVPQSSDVQPQRVGLSALELITAAAARGPLCLLVDDAQWIDQQSWEVLAFLGRRLEADPVLLLAAVREGPEATARLEGSGLPELTLQPLAPDAAVTLLDRVAPDLSPVLKTKVIAQSEGNPLGIIELAGVAVRLDAAAPLPDSLPLTARLERTYAAVVSGLPAETRSLLLVGALDDSDQVQELTSAGSLLLQREVSADSFQPAVAAGLVVTDGITLTFRHPLIRSAVRQAASLSERLAAHAAIAEVLPADIDRTVWHRAAAAVGPDEDLARLLASMAARARQAAPDVALAAFERSVTLSEDAQARADRLLWAAVAAHDLGAVSKVRALLDTVDRRDLRGAQHAWYLWSREALLGESFSAGTRATRMLDILQRMIDEEDHEHAIDSLELMALTHWWAVPSPAARAELLALADQLDTGPAHARLVRVFALVAPLERCRQTLRSLAELVRDPPSNPSELGALLQSANAVGDYGTAALFAQNAVDGTRRLGLADLIACLIDQAYMAAHTGRPRLAITAGEEARALAVETRQPLHAIAASLNGALGEALRGNIAAALQIADQEEARLQAGTPHPFFCLIQVARGVALLADGRSQTAYEQLVRVFDPADPAYHPYVRLSVLAHLAEAGTLAGHTSTLNPIVEECRRIAADAPFPVLDVGLRYASAVLADDHRAEDAFAAALAVPLDAWPFDRARLQLACGAWLRRQRRPGDARPHLRAAQQAFDALGTVPWAERARRELRATGETVRRSADKTAQLTGQELHIAQLAAAGLSNKEIASQLYLSPRTVSTHLYRIYPKVGVRSRSGLAAALRTGLSPGQADGRHCPAALSGGRANDVRHFSDASPGSREQP